MTGIVDYLAKLGKYNFQAEGIVMGVSEDHVIDCYRNWSNDEDGEGLNNMWWTLTLIVNSKNNNIFI